jgi:hypothetical protein
MSDWECSNTNTITPLDSHEVDTIQRQLNTPQYVLDSPTSPELSQNRWVVTWYPGKSCRHNARREADSKPRACKNVADAKSIKFEAVRKFTLLVYAAQGCNGVPRTFNYDTVCETIPPQGRSYKVAGEMIVSPYMIESFVGSALASKL